MIIQKPSQDVIWSEYPLIALPVRDQEQPRAFDCSCRHDDVPRRDLQFFAAEGPRSRPTEIPSGVKGELRHARIKPYLRPVGSAEGAFKYHSDITPLKGGKFSEPDRKLLSGGATRPDGF